MGYLKILAVRVFKGFLREKLWVRSFNDFFIKSLPDYKLIRAKLYRLFDCVTVCILELVPQELQTCR